MNCGAFKIDEIEEFVFIRDLHLRYLSILFSFLFLNLTSMKKESICNLGNIGVFSGL